MKSYIISRYSPYDYKAVFNNVLGIIPMKDKVVSSATASRVRSSVIKTFEITNLKYYYERLDKSLTYAENTIYKLGINVSQPEDVLWCIPTKHFAFAFPPNINQKCMDIVDIILTNSIIWHELMARVWLWKYSNKFLYDLNPTGVLVIQMILALKFLERNYARGAKQIWTCPSNITYGSLFDAIFQRMISLMECKELEKLVLRTNEKNYLATYKLKENGPGVHTVKSSLTRQTASGKPNKTNTDTMNYLHTNEAIIATYKANGSYDIINSSLPCRVAAKKIADELGIKISHATIANIRKRIQQVESPTHQLTPPEELEALLSNLWSSP